MCQSRDYGRNGHFNSRKKSTVFCTFVLLLVGDLLELFALHPQVIPMPREQQLLSLRSSFQK